MSSWGQVGKGTPQRCTAEAAGLLRHVDPNGSAAHRTWTCAPRRMPGWLVGHPPVSLTLPPNSTCGMVGSVMLTASTLAGGLDVPDLHSFCWPRSPLTQGGEEGKLVPLGA
jgi:hypothetical protein